MAGDILAGLSDSRVLDAGRYVDVACCSRAASITVDVVVRAAAIDRHLRATLGTRPQ